MQNKIVPIDEMKILLDKFFKNSPEVGFYDDVMADYEDAVNHDCKFVLLTFNDEGDVHWDFLADVQLCDDPNCMIDHSGETGMSEDTFNSLKSN
jgi:hypothetical protein